MSEVFYNVKNRSSSRVGYSIPEDGIRRTFAPGEMKRISHSELLKLSWQPGGREMMIHFLQIQNEKELYELSINPQPEYYMNEQQVVDLLTKGTLDAFLDCLDFAPIGVIDLIKKYAVSLPLNDVSKRQALLEKKGFNVEKAIENTAPDTPVTEEKKTAAAAPAVPAGRRTAVDYKAPASAPAKAPAATTTVKTPTTTTASK